MRLIPTPPGRIVGGEVMFDGQDLLTLPDDEMRAIRGNRIAMIFQDPMTSLNPFMRISRQLMEVTQLHLGHSQDSRRASTPSRCSRRSGIPDARAARRRLSARVLRRHAAARDDCDGAVVQVRSC